MSEFAVDGVTVVVGELGVGVEKEEEEEVGWAVWTLRLAAFGRANAWFGLRC